MLYNYSVHLLTKGRVKLWLFKKKLLAVFKLLPSLLTTFFAKSAFEAWLRRLVFRTLYILYKSSSNPYYSLQRVQFRRIFRKGSTRFCKWDDTKFDLKACWYATCEVIFRFWLSHLLILTSLCRGFGFEESFVVDDDVSLSSRQVHIFASVAPRRIWLPQGGSMQS